MGSWDEDAVNRYNGTTGAYIDKYVTAGLGGLSRTTGLDFIPEQQVTVLGPTLSSAALQSFNVGDPPTTASTLTITEHATTGTITAANDLRIRIPDSFNMVWDTSVTSVTLGGAASGKVSATLLAYEDGAKTAVIDVTSDFAAGDVLTLADLAFTSFSASSAGRLTLGHTRHHRGQ